ncbi:transporter substrate-binding domain-containing diguanylate cyclase [Caminibacter pacificus]
MRLILLFFAVFLYGFNFYIPENYSGEIPNNFKIKKYKSLKDVNFTDSLVLISSDNLPYVLKHNLKILIPVGEKREYILSNIDSLSKIKTIANLDLPSKILLDKVNGRYKEVNATFKDFQEKKIDAIVVEKKRGNEDYFDFYLPSYGIVFNKYLIVYKNNMPNLKNINRKFEKIFDFKIKPVYVSLILTGYYLNTKIDFNKILFENYYVQKEAEEKLKVAVTPNWPPFDIYKNKELQGIGIDFFKLIAKKAGLNYRFVRVNYWPDVLEMIKEKEADITPNTSETPDRKKYALFSKPYYSFPLGIVCNSNSHIKSFSQVREIAVGKDFTAEKLMRAHYPGLRYIEVKNVKEALSMAAKNKNICAVDMLPVILWNIQKLSMYNLSLIYQTPFKFNLQIMVRKDRPDLVQKINMAIDSLSQEEKNRIINRYIGGILKEEKNTNWWPFVLIGFIVLVFSVSIILKYRKSSMTDELTGILNRRGIIKEAKKISVESTLLFFDIDHFKKINDTYGHDFGDYVLKELTKLITQNIRNSDVFGRWGGEEFVLILRGTKYPDGLKVAEKIRKIIENHDFKGVKVTISIGVAPFRGDLQKAVEKADEALYKAKNGGRNQVKGIE